MVGKLEAYMSEYRTEKASAIWPLPKTWFDEARQQYYEAQQHYARAVDANRNIARQSAQVELDRLQNEQQLAFGVYSQLAQQLENAKIKVQEQMPCVTIIEPASVPVNRSNMGKPTILFIFVFLGLMAGTGYVVIKELFFHPAIPNSAAPDRHASRQLKSSMKVVLPASECFSMMLPLCIRMICLDTLRPMPEPFGLVVKKGTKILAATSAGMPQPLSVTSTATCSASVQ